MHESLSCEIDEAVMRSCIEMLRDAKTSADERGVAEAALFRELMPIAQQFAKRSSLSCVCDVDQIVNDAVYKLLVKYLCKSHFDFRSVGHVVKLLGRITTNTCRMENRRSNQSKRVARDRDGHRLYVQSLNDLLEDCPVNGIDPSYEYENQEYAESCLQCLKNSYHRQIFAMLIADFTWEEMSTSLNVSRKTIRLWVDQVRRIIHRSLRPGQLMLSSPKKTGITRCLQALDSGENDS